jgi:hypothetical protein
MIEYRVDIYGALQMSVGQVAKLHDKNVVTAIKPNFPYQLILSN